MLDDVLSESLLISFTPSNLVRGFLLPGAPSNPACQSSIRQDLFLVTQTALCSHCNRSSVVICNYYIDPITVDIMPGENTIFTTCVDVNSWGRSACYP